MSTAPGKAADIVNQQTEQLRLARQEIRRLGPDLLGLEARVLVERAETFDSYRLIRMTFPNRSPRELRELGKLLQKEPGVIAVLAGYDGYELSLVVNCAADSGVSAKELLARQVGPVGGRGGGGANFAQGGGLVTEKQIETLLDDTKDNIPVIKIASN